MNTKKYKVLFYFITATIVATIGVQFFWNYKNYEENKQRVRNEIQLSLDNALEEYYSSLAKSNFLTIIEDKINNDKNSLSKITLGNAVNNLKENFSIDEETGIQITNLKFTSDEKMTEAQRDSLMNITKEFVSTFNLKTDSLSKKNKTKASKVFTKLKDNKKGFTYNSDGSKKEVTYFEGKKAADSLKLVSNLKPIFISFLEQSIEYNVVDSLIENQLNQKGIDLKTSFHHLKNDTLFHQTKDSVLKDKLFSVSSKSTYAKENESFKLLYNNPNIEALKRSSFGIFLSLLLSLIIISCLFYLLKIINQQKDLAAIKNDLISNITHEFKTPIATVSTAIEAIENFNVLDDKEKTRKYLAMSTIQLKKLHVMVEKLLETATLDSEQLLLKKEPIDLVEFTELVINKHQLIANNKQLLFTTNTQPILITVDVFHLENVLSNLVDNAIKYGGDKIEVNIKNLEKAIEIKIIDDGDGIEKNQQEKIFDKFYRVPKGNTHNVKGFGIGLYYCKHIIEKHGGTIAVSSDKKQTTFTINLPHA